uniref:Uncharacterized protein n=1 Tax=Araneus ventricosus TaxID=182803 RepID=A0A4Y2HY11_ARAVE|nr:hypothetical protein AVEN_236017-1 [Araneus ventricosus]GBM70203.1 hypothetical protein AVEN_62767-1 [Araneus ventricosus]
MNRNSPNKLLSDAVNIKPSQNRIGNLSQKCEPAFGLGTMVYNGLEFGSFFEIPSSSPCYSILLGINPVLQMMFTFAQMYFIFANARVGAPLA